MKTSIITLGLLVLFQFSPLVQANDEGFPGRAEFPEVRVYDMKKLYEDYNKVVIVDARSKYEYETLRIKDAIHIPIAKKSFADQVVALRLKTDKPIVFYCNGRSCLKSYQSCVKADKAGVKNLYAYDAGVFEWATAYPSHAMLLGKNPMDPRDIIPKKKFKAHLLDTNKFGEKAYDLGRSRSLIIDVRDKFQRGATGFFVNKERWASLDDQAKLKNYLRQAVAEKKTLFIYDEVGKQVRWLQYTLEQEKIHDYYFMNKGARAYWDTLMKF